MRLKRPKLCLTPGQSFTWRTLKLNLAPVTGKNLSAAGVTSQHVTEIECTHTKSTVGDPGEHSSSVMGCNLLTCPVKTSLQILHQQSCHLLPQMLAFIKLC